MSNSVKHTPDGYRSVTPYLFIQGATRAIDFYKQVFGAVERMRLEMPGGLLCHAELEIGDSVIMLADEFPSMKAFGPATIGGTPVMIHLYVQDVDAVVAQALAAGAKLLQAAENKFYGDRSASITDPFGHQWGIATHVEDVSPDEISRRAATLFSGPPGGDKTAN